MTKWKKKQVDITKYQIFKNVSKCCRLVSENKKNIRFYGVPTSKHIFKTSQRILMQFFNT
jgi:hypothetical protein